MLADDIGFLQVARPARADVIGVIVRRQADVGEPGLAGGDFLGDALGLLPLRLFVDAQGLALAGEGELAGHVAMAVLVDDAADRIGIEARGGASTTCATAACPDSGSLRASK